MTKQFHNPYQFVPVTGKVNGQDTSTLKFADILSGASFVRHDRWDQDSYSGRMLCRLTTLSPLVIGGTHDPENQNVHPKPIPPYRNQNGISIPGNSLRGMVASVAEAISQSSMRVLGEVGSRDSIYSVRKPMQNSLKAVGLLQRDDDGNASIIPVAMVAIPLEASHLPAKWQKAFGKDTALRECVASYVGNYKGKYDKTTQALNSGKLQSYHSETNTTFYSMALQTPADLTASSKINLQADYLHTRGPVLLGQTFAELQDGVNSSKVNGVLFVVGANNKNRDMPRKKHELFLPFNSKTLTRNAIPVSENLIARFENILRQRFNDDAQKLYLPEGYNRRSSLMSDNLCAIVQSGDLIYFDVNSDASTVTDISYTAIWRDIVPGSLTESLRTSAGLNRLPWGNNERTALTPAEQMFGAVEDQKKRKHKARDGDKQQNSKSLASRIRFFDAVAENSELALMPETPLKILASPKPPSPALYCSRSGYVKKTDLDFSDSENATEINGRKRYLPQPKANKETWETQKADDKTKKQRVVCTPIPDKETFYFHIDFENLSASELGLLTVAVNPLLNNPDSSFQHQLGMGKPFGLGQIQIEKIGTFLIDRKQRYSESGLLNPTRYHQWYSNIQETDDQWKVHYPQEFKTSQIHQALTDEEQILGFSAYVDQDSVDILTTIGDAENVVHPVCYPFVDGEDYYSESEGYSWFVNNDNHKRPKNGQSLQAVEAGKKLPYLETNN